MVDNFSVAMAMILCHEELNRFLKRITIKYFQKKFDMINFEFVLCIDRMEVIDQQFEKFLVHNNHYLHEEKTK